MKTLNLEKLIYQVKKELLSAQQNHEGEMALFRLSEVEMDVSITAEYNASGGIDLHVVELGGEASTAHTHSVKLKFSLEPEKQAATHYKIPSELSDLVKVFPDTNIDPALPDTIKKQIVGPETTYFVPVQFGQGIDLASIKDILKKAQGK